MNEFFKLKTEVEEEIRKDVKYIAIYADNLSRKDCLLVQKYVKTACRMYDVDCHVEGAVMNVLHDIPKFYQMYVPKENGKYPGWMAVELTNYFYVMRFGCLVMGMIITGWIAGSTMY